MQAGEGAGAIFAIRCIPCIFRNDWSEIRILAVETSVFWKDDSSASSFAVAPGRLGCCNSIGSSRIILHLPPVPYRTLPHPLIAHRRPILAARRCRRCRRRPQGPFQALQVPSTVTANQTKPKQTKTKKNETKKPKQMNAISWFNRQLSYTVRRLEANTYQFEELAMKAITIGSHALAVEILINRSPSYREFKSLNL